MFMFRMMIYLYELKHARHRETPGRHAQLLLPAAELLLHALSRWSITGRMQRGYFADDVHAIQRRGLEMMFRGTIHLLCYRLVYHELLIPRRRGSRPLEPGRLPGLQLPALPPGLGPVPHGLRHAPPLRLPASRDSSPLPAGDGIHRLLATDQHLLERLHGPALLQSGGVPAQAMAPARWRWRWRR